MASPDPVSNCAECERLLRQLAALQAQVEKLAKALEDSQRAGKRQAAPFAKPKRKATFPPPQPGRKSGEEHGPHAHRVAPEQIDETHLASLPECCPECGGKSLFLNATAVQHQTEVVRTFITRRFHVEIGGCRDCQARVQGRHPLQTSDALGSAGNQLGAEAHATIAILNKDCGLSYGKIARLFKTLFDITIARSTACRSQLKTALQCHAAYENLRRDIRGSPWVVPDETGWRVAGKSAWLHAFVGQRETVYAIDSGRGHEPLAKLIGKDYAGALIHDGWAVYDCFQSATHQQCLAHLLRRCKELQQTAIPGAVRFPRMVQAVLQHGLRVRDRYRAGELTPRGVLVCAGQLTERLRRLVAPIKTHPGNERFAKFLEQHIEHLFAFLRQPRWNLDATNWRAEQAIRPAVVNRKVWGGNRTWNGAAAQAILTSVLVTCGQRTQNAFRWLTRARQSPIPLLLTA